MTVDQTRCKCFYLIHVAVLSLSKKSAHHQNEELERIDRYKGEAMEGNKRRKQIEVERIIQNQKNSIDQNYEASRKIEVKVKTKTEEFLSRVVLHSRGRGS